MSLLLLLELGNPSALGSRAFIKFIKETQKMLHSSYFGDVINTVQSSVLAARGKFYSQISFKFSNMLP